MQVLKEDVRNKILLAAEELFYEKDYRSAKLTEIAEVANIPVALIYTYFKNKAALFDEIVRSVYTNFTTALDEEESISGSPSEKFEEVGEKYIFELLNNHRKFVILMDKSSGTKHMNAKEDLICRLQKHIEIGLKSHFNKTYDPMLAHILASNFAESLLEIARHYKDEKWAREMFGLVTQCYYKGVESL